MTSAAHSGPQPPAFSSLEVEWLPAVELKLADSFDLPGSLEQLSIASLIPAHHPLQAIAGSLQSRSMFLTTTEDQLRRLVDRAMRLDPDYRPPRFAHLLRVRTPDVDTAHRLAAALRSQTSIVGFAEVQRVVPPPGVVTPVNDPLHDVQVQHDPPPSGVNARGAWALGIDGAGITLLDLERGYDPHDDLPANIPLVHGDPAHLRNLSPEHGTAVLGVVGGLDNQSGGIGIAPGATLQFAMRYWGVTTDERFADALTSSMLALGYGDVLLIDDQYGLEIGGSVFAMPIELHPVVATFLSTIEAHGIVLVQPAGNGSLLIDGYCLPASGAVIVGGISPTTLRREAYEYQSNFGTRVDCHARYGGIVTTGWNADQTAHGGFSGSGPPNSPTAYSQSFRGTSASAAIVAGAACLVQSFNLKRFGYRLSPGDLRDYLRTCGLPSQDPGDLVGVMPDVGDCIAKLGAPGPIMIRAENDDNGQIPRGPGGGCPDIVLLAEAPKPPPVFAAREPFADLPVILPPWRKGGHLFVRARAQSANPVAGVAAEVYACPPSFLPSAKAWRRIGTAWIGEVPSDGELHASGPVPCDLSLVQKWGGCSLIAVLRADRLPTPSPDGIRTDSEMRRFLENNLVVGVLTRLLPKVPPGQSAVPYLQEFGFPVAPAPDPRGRAALNVATTLPASTEVSLWIPASAISPSNVAGPGWSTADGHVRIPVPSGEGVRVELGLTSSIRCRLRFEVPLGSRLASGRFGIAQTDGHSTLGIMGGMVRP
jgi:hypothetical protein